MNILGKIAQWFKRFAGIKPIIIGIVGYPGIGKTVYLTTLYGISCVLRQSKKIKVIAGKSQQYFHTKWNQITGVERQFLQKQVQQTQFNFKITLVPSRAFRSQTLKVEFADPPGEALTVNPQASTQ
jgi:predicted ATPase